MDPPPPPLGPVDFPTIGWQVVDWIEANLCHGPGDIAGDPIVLDEEFIRFVCHCYRLDERTGRRLRRRAVLSRPKGRAKSELAGMLVCAEFMGPVRFDGWDAQGDPVGRPVRSPFIRCLATEETQAGNTYDNVRWMLAHAVEHGGREFAGVDVGATRVLLNRVEGEIRPSSASAASKDGGKETFGVADEIHLYTLPELKQMHRTVMRNLAKRKAAEPWMLDTTTMYAIGELSVAEATMDDPPPGVLIDHREARRWMTSMDPTNPSSLPSRTCTAQPPSGWTCAGFSKRCEIQRSRRRTPAATSSTSATRRQTHS